MAEPEEPKKPEEPVKEYRVYRGVETPVENIQNLPAAIQRPTAKGKLPRLAIIKAVANSWNYGHKTVTLWVPGQGETHLDVKNSEVVNALTGTRATRLMDEYQEWAVKHLPLAVTTTPKSIGADPEIFVTDANGEVIPAWKFLGSKGSPTMTKHGLKVLTNVYWDGFQAEFTTDPHDCLAFFVDNIQRSLKAVLEAAKAHDPKARLSHRSVLPVDRKILATAANEHVEFGCMPSQNVYGLHGSNLPGREVPMRFAGGHIHIGTKGKKYDLESCVKGMDAVLGVPSVALFGSFDVPVRREYYGLAGEYRTPPHGLEYRTLSNAWLMHPVLTHIVYEIGRLGFDYGVSGVKAFGPQEEIRDIIQSSDPNAARAYMTKYKDVYLALFSKLPPFKDSEDTLYGALFNGAEAWIKDPTDFEGNWNFHYWVTHSDGPNKNWGMARNVIARGQKL